VILEAAAQVLEAGGLAGFTTNAVAERAGVSIGTLYQYFSDKGAVLRALAEREKIPYQMEILPFGGTDAGGVQRLHGGIPSVTLSIPCRYVHTPNEMVNASDVESCITLLARYLEEAHEGDYAL